MDAAVFLPSFPGIFASLCWSDIDRLNRYHFTLLISSVVCTKSPTQLVMFIMGFMGKSQGRKLMDLIIRLQTFYNLPGPSPVVWFQLTVQLSVWLMNKPFVSLLFCLIEPATLCAGKRSCSQVSWHVHTVHIFYPLCKIEGHIFQGWWMWVLTPFCI